MTRSTFEEITTKEPYKPLLEPQKRGSGRNNQGRLSVRHRGGGEKQHYRRIDFKRDKLGVPARLATIEYDPNRSARIGLLHYRDDDVTHLEAVRHEDVARRREALHPRAARPQGG
jgi:large subunit ribosomal protein L2